jgi:hypothetical protein
MGLSGICRVSKRSIQFSAPVFNADLLNFSSEEQGGLKGIRGLKGLLLVK